MRGMFVVSHHSHTHQSNRTHYICSYFTLPEHHTFVMEWGLAMNHGIRALPLPARSWMCTYGGASINASATLITYGSASINASATLITFR